MCSRFLGVLCVSKEYRSIYYCCMWDYNGKKHVSFSGFWISRKMRVGSGPTGIGILSCTFLGKIAKSHNRRIKKTQTTKREKEAAQRQKVNCCNVSITNHETRNPHTHHTRHGRRETGLRGSEQVFLCSCLPLAVPYC